MKKNIAYTLGIIGAIIFGFSLAWFSKPSEKIETKIQDNQNHSMSGNMEEQIYTCAMHPQIRQNEPGLCPICEMELILVESNNSSNPLILTMTEAAVKLSNIQTTIIGSSIASTGNNSIFMTGKVKSDETTASSLVSHLPGRIEKLYISYTGEKVVKGQKLIDIYSPELISAQQELLQAKSLKEVNPNLLSAAKSKLRNWKLTENMINNVLEKEEVQEIFTFYAEQSGIVSKRRISVGDYVKRGEALFDLIDLDKVWIIFDAYEEDLSKIKIGDRIEFTATALGTRKFNTVVSFIDPIINPQTRTASIRTESNNTRGLLKPEMFVNGIHMAREQKTTNSLSIPKTSVLWTGQRSVVYVKKPNTDIPSFEYREVMLGERIGDFYKVEKGLEAGEEIVVNGSFTIDAAAQLNNQSSMMNKNVIIKQKNVEETIPDYKIKTPTKLKSQISIVLDTYIILKDALVNDLPEKAKSSATILLDNLNTIEMSQLNGDSHDYWMKQSKIMTSQSAKIAGTNEIEEQRNGFESLSQALINTISAFGIENKKVFVEFCPMASNNKGAVWLSFDETIRNPYFGEKMMSCGVVQDTLSD